MIVADEVATAATATTDTTGGALSAICGGAVVVRECPQAFAVFPARSVAWIQ